MKRVAVVVIGLAVVLAGCGGDDESSRADHNDADVEFAQGMIPHHEQAVEMAQFAEGRAESDDVRKLAGDIEAAQDPEIETMTGWLEDWDEETDSGASMEGNGMMSEGQMADLEAASGSEFDRLFLEQMSEHHRGAITMAETELDDGEFPDALELAEGIRDTQRREVETMQRLLTEVG